MITFEYLDKSEFATVSEEIFNILAENMEAIAPSKNSREEEFVRWHKAVGGGLQQDERQIVLIKAQNELIGFFQYYTNADTLMMEEIQFKPTYQSKGVFRKLYGFLLSNINAELRFVQAYADTRNGKSIGILEKMGLLKIGAAQGGRLYHFKGRYEDFKRWFASKECDAK